MIAMFLLEKKNNGYYKWFKGSLQSKGTTSAEEIKLKQPL